MKVSALTLLILKLNALVDSGHYNNISIADVHQAIDSKCVLRFLEVRAGKDIDLSVHFSHTWGDFESYYEDKLSEIYIGYAGDEYSKWGVQNLGLCLLIAWTNEIIQQGKNIGFNNQSE